MRYSFSWMVLSLLVALLGIEPFPARARLAKLAPDGIEMSPKGQLPRQNLRYCYVEQPCSDFEGILPPFTFKIPTANCEIRGWGASDKTPPRL